MIDSKQKVPGIAAEDLLLIKESLRAESRGCRACTGRHDRGEKDCARRAQCEAESRGNRG